jgi:hypothetical protein
MLRHGMRATGRDGPRLCARACAAGPPGPHIIHYGVDWSINWKDEDNVERKYDFNKLLYLALDVASCPRWFMPLPPFASAEPTAGAGRKSYRETICGGQIKHFNEAICEYYGRHCRTPVVCPPADGETARRRLKMARRSLCVDLTQNCLSWARRGECDSKCGASARAPRTRAHATPRRQDPSRAPLPRVACAQPRVYGR